jgi:hypothetical protein
MKNILDQLARTGLLWDDEMVAGIFAGNMPPMEEIVLMLVIGATDAEAYIRTDPKSSLNDKRNARAFLAIVFLAAISCTKQQEITL